MTISSHVFLLLLLAYFLYTKILNRKIKIIENKLNLLKNKALQLALLVSITATSGSLFFSEILGYEPCKLCWFQRILMYPQVVIFSVALLKNKKDVAEYTLSLSLIGAFIASYHYLTTKFSASVPNSISNFCSTTEASCLIQYLSEYGYVNIPMMSLTAFALLILFSYLSKLKK